MRAPAAAFALLLPLPAAAQSGAELVEQTCAACHATALIDRSMGYDEAAGAR